ncbi:MAG: glycosyltransferase family 4 protein [Candidatus Paceibacterota bacterium]|jgi:glycosyltransferase involved in cell wall biosynthesis
MKILLINYEFPPLGGGAGNATKNIAREMSSLGHSVFVISTWFSGLPEEEVTDGYTILRVHSLRKKEDRSNIFEMFDFVRKVIGEKDKFVKNFKPDVIISFFAIPTGIIAYYFKKKYGIPYILSLRGGDVPGFLPINLRYYHTISYPITNLIWENSSGIVANSKGLQKLAEKTSLRFNKKVEYISNGVNTEEFFPDLNKKDPETLNVIFVGRLTEQKGVIFLIKAIERLIKEDKSLRGVLKCDIIGDGPLRKSLEIEAENRDLQDNIKFYGWIHREELLFYYQKADVFVLPSYDEGMPNVILEAIASGLAIIATDIAGNEELVSDGVNGFLYKEQSDLQGLIDKFIKNHGLKHQFGASSLEKAREFSWKSVSEKYIDICQKIK